MSCWSVEGVPHKGWRYVGMEDLGENALPSEDIQYEQCQMCGRERIRYIHILEHRDFPEELRVGCVCASKLTDDYVNPQERERDLRNRSNRRQTFMRREWRYKEDTGNYTLRYKGEYINSTYDNIFFNITFLFVSLLIFKEMKTKCCGPLRVS